MNEPQDMNSGLLKTTYDDSINDTLKRRREKLADKKLPEKDPLDG